MQGGLSGDRQQHSRRHCDGWELGIAASNVMVESAVVGKIVEEPLFFNEERVLLLVKYYTTFCLIGLGIFDVLSTLHTNTKKRNRQKKK